MSGWLSLLFKLITCILGLGLHFQFPEILNIVLA
jgi:hypothetical protein